MGKFEATTSRLFRRVFVCKRCKTKIRTDINKVLQKKVKCRNCQGKAFRPIKTKK